MGSELARPGGGLVGTQGSGVPACALEEQTGPHLPGTAPQPAGAEAED